MLTIMHVAVSRGGFRDRNANEARLGLLALLLRIAAQQVQPCSSCRPGLCTLATGQRCSACSRESSVSPTQAESP